MIRCHKIWLCVFDVIKNLINKKNMYSWKITVNIPPNSFHMNIMFEAKFRCKSNKNILLPTATIIIYSRATAWYFFHSQYTARRILFLFLQKKKERNASEATNLVLVFTLLMNGMSKMINGKKQSVIGNVKFSRYTWNISFKPLSDLKWFNVRYTRNYIRIGQPCSVIVNSDMCWSWSIMEFSNVKQQL